MTYVFAVFMILNLTSKVPFCLFVRRSFIHLFLALFKIYKVGIFSYQNCWQTTKSEWIPNKLRLQQKYCHERFKFMPWSTYDHHLSSSQTCIQLNLIVYQNSMIIEAKFVPAPQFSPPPQLIPPTVSKNHKRTE